MLEELLSSLRVAEEGIDTAPLLDVVEDGDLLACLTEAAGAAALGQLACCSRALRNCCTADNIWEALLRERWGENAVPRAGISGPLHRLYASRHVRERWASAPPATTPQTAGGGGRRRQAVATRPSPAACVGLRTPLGRGKENLSPSASNRPPMRTPTGAKGSPSAARLSSLSSLGLPSSQATACARARLQLGLQQLMLSGPRAVSAFPVDEEMDVWMATAQCPPGGPHGGAALSLRLTFDLSKGLDECLPTVELLQPACFHPNVGEGGLLCPQALR